MKPTSKEVIEAVSNHCSHQLTLYKFNRGVLQISEKYREGRLTALEYIGELTFYYQQEEKNLQQYLHDQILKQMQLYSCLDDTEYKQGLYDALNDILDYKKDFIERKIHQKKQTKFA
ncbi:hypothetical protein [Sulfurovum riftiae]|uniref:Uncharacterized protein n=1 Tax=Sulfurovum riftiae TaxID=1630136 RepID=A0A151CJQ9_9BACT|nr:hypothetical protein [Sulfurovum riftiae]KYJ87770.1 hypothetical protein AS592_10545 [Sulfurovum riftiae]